MRRKKTSALLIQDCSIAEQILSYSTDFMWKLFRWDQFNAKYFQPTRNLTTKWPTDSSKLARPGANGQLGGLQRTCPTNLSLILRNILF